MSKKIIIHSANSHKKVRRALKIADFAEVDVAKSFFGKEFILQHNGILGKLGIGPGIRPLLGEKYQNKIIFDLKHPKFSFYFNKLFGQMLVKRSFKNAMITSSDWQTVSKIAKIYHYRPFYYLDREKDKNAFIRMLPTLAFPEGVITPVKLINRTWIKKMQKYQIKLIAWAKNKEEENLVDDLPIFAKIVDFPKK